MYKALIIWLIVLVGSAPAVVAVVLATRKPSLVFAFLLLGVAFICYSPPWTEVTTCTIPAVDKLGGFTLVSERRLGHFWEGKRSHTADSPSVQIAYEICLPQLYAEIAVLVAVATLLYVLLCTLLERQALR